MRILGIETSGDTSSVALVQDGKALTERVFASRMALSQTLTGHIQAVTGAAVLSDAGLEGIAVSLGPGSFTGLRVGVALAKALALVLRIPLVGLATHDVMADAVRECGLPVLVLQHARERDVYTSRYMPDCAGGMARGVMPVGEAVAGALAAGPHPVLLVGDAVERHAELIADHAQGLLEPVAAEVWQPRASTVAALAEPLMADADPDAPLDLRPIYMLSSQAERTHGVDLGLS